MTKTPAPDSELRPGTGLHDDAVAVLTSWPAPNGAQERLRRRFLFHLDIHRDAMLRSCRPDHLTASALIVSTDRSHVLLTLHRRALRWLQTGGHCEPTDTHLAAAALREATEESGIDDLRIGTAPVLLACHDVEFCARHLDVQYLAIAPAHARIHAQGQSGGARWWPANALPDGVDDSLRALVAACT